MSQMKKHTLILRNPLGISDIEDDTFVDSFKQEEQKSNIKFSFSDKPKTDCELKIQCVPLSFTSQ